MIKPYFETKLGKLYHGDCLEIMPEVRPIDVILTDPPYSSPVVCSYGRKIIKNYGDLSLQKHYFKSFKSIIEPKLKGSIFIFCDAKYYPILFEVFYEWEVFKMLVWDKGRIGMGSPFRCQYELICFASKVTGTKSVNGKTYSDIIKAKPVPSKDRLHGAQKPVKLLKDIISGFVSNNGIVLDPYAGSCSVAIACERLNRRWIGIEIEEKYCEISAQRIEHEREQLKMFK